VCGGGSDCESRLDCTPVNDATSMAENVIPADGVETRSRLDFTLLPASRSDFVRKMIPYQTKRVGVSDVHWRMCVFYMVDRDVLYSYTCRPLLRRCDGRRFCKGDIFRGDEGYVTLAEVILRCFWLEP
jgi:hypothetical protein